jgi:phosphoribosylglycinamide formyltransferase 2
MVWQGGQAMSETTGAHERSDLGNVSGGQERSDLGNVPGAHERGETDNALARSEIKVMLLGAGDAGHELELAFERLGALVIAVEHWENADHLIALLSEHAPGYVVATSADVPPDVLIAAADLYGVEVFPAPRAMRLSVDREGLRRLAADELGLPTVPFWFASTEAELDAVAEHAGFPLAVTPLSAAQSDGRSVMLRPEDVEPAWRMATNAPSVVGTRVMAESLVDVDEELTLLTVRTTGPAGPAVHFCEPIGHREHPEGPLESWQPQPLPPTALDAARSIAARIVNSLGGRGVFSVELLVNEDEVYFSTINVLTGDSGLVTLRSQRLSQFELHARAILGLPLDTIMISPAAAEVAEAAGSPLPAPVLAEALSIPETDVRLLGGSAVALASAPDVVRARDRAHRVAVALSTPTS